jgi:hypothetical protein
LSSDQKFIRSPERDGNITARAEGPFGVLNSITRITLASGLGHRKSSQRANVRPLFTPITDFAKILRHFRLVPTADIGREQMR